METETMIKSLEKIAEKLGTTAQTIFGYYVKNAKMYKIYFIIELLTSIIFLIVGLFFIINFIPDNYEWNFKDGIFFGIGCFFTMGGFLVFITTAPSISRFINAWVNPEYEAIEDLFLTLKND